MPFGESSRERGNLSLDLHTIRPLADFGARRENDLRGTGYAWTPVLVSFFKLLEVGFSPYLSFIPILRVFRCFGWFEAVRGRLIGPKTWDRIVGIFLRFSLVAISVQSHVGAVWVDYVLIYVLICALVCIGPEMAEKSGFTK